VWREWDVSNLSQVNVCGTNRSRELCISQDRNCLPTRATHSSFFFCFCLCFIQNSIGVNLTYQLYSIHLLSHFHLIWKGRPLCSGYFHNSTLYIPVFPLFSPPVGNKRFTVRWTERQTLQPASKMILSVEVWQKKICKQRIMLLFWIHKTMTFFTRFENTAIIFRRNVFGGTERWNTYIIF